LLAVVGDIVLAPGVADGEGDTRALGLIEVVVELLELGLLAIDIDGTTLIAVHLDLTRALVIKLGKGSTGGARHGQCKYCDQHLFHGTYLNCFNKVE